MFEAKIKTRKYNSNAIILTVMVIAETDPTLTQELTQVDKTSRFLHLNIHNRL